MREMLIIQHTLTVYLNVIGELVEPVLLHGMSGNSVAMVAPFVVRDFDPWLVVAIVCVESL